MLRKFVLSFTVFLVAIAILSVSVLQTASVSYAVSVPTPAPKVAIENKTSDIDYTFPYPGTILPDSPFWSFKAIRDKVLYTFTINPLKKAELALLFADKRLLLSKSLFENKKPDIALSTLSKGEKYLEIAVNQEWLARQKGVDTKDFLIKLATSSLKHRQFIEEMLPLVPEDGKPTVIKTEDYCKNTYKSSRDALNSLGTTAPMNPFDDNK